ncbi:hypothetical protein [Nocardiopsis synnemataformans]|uniref:hypothetical protein n=1 Tax=Nocardiopsis synnemataformans TaxID=61305 RepID=UPI003EBC5110
MPTVPRPERAPLPRDVVDFIETLRVALDVPADAPPYALRDRVTRIVGALDAAADGVGLDGVMESLALAVAEVPSE